jgi:aldehyde dehydrogenase (NAD+)
MKVSNALAAGKTVVLTPSPLTPVAGLALARIIDAHRHSTGRGQRRHAEWHRGEQGAGHRLAQRHGQFTGSSAVGREVMAPARRTMKQILLECGGKSAGILLDDVEVTDELLERILHIVGESALNA